MSTSLLIVCCFGIPLSWLLESICIRPKAQPFWLRHWAANLVHVSNWCLCFALVLIVTQRPWFSLAIIGCAQLFMLLVNQAKYHSLREPFLAQDFEYFSDAIRHPRLYVPFFGIWRIILAVVTVGGAVTAGLSLEPSSLDNASVGTFVLHILILMVTSATTLKWAIKQLPAPSLKPVSDQKIFGQFAFLYSYFALLFKPVVITSDLAPAIPSTSIYTSSDDDSVNDLPHIVVVQSESFFDPRTCYPIVNPKVLQHFDKICLQSLQYGNLKVPAWGANTVRTEAAFLTGLDASTLGIHQFNPYRLFAKQPVASLAKCLQQAGYKTLCIHPYPVSFYLRDKVFPALGFNQFLDVKHFCETDKQGQYTSDLAVAAAVDKLLKESAEPLFIFVISMENHGPLHLEPVNNNELEPIFTEQGAVQYLSNKAQLKDLNTYLRHLRNADKMAQQLTNSLKNNTRAGILTWYGDHIPIMPDVYHDLTEPSPDTPYYIWHSEQAKNNTQPITREVHTLAEEILACINK